MDDDDEKTPPSPGVVSFLKRNLNFYRIHLIFLCVLTVSPCTFYTYPEQHCYSSSLLRCSLRCEWRIPHLLCRRFVQLCLCYDRYWPPNNRFVVPDCFSTIYIICPNATRKPGQFTLKHNHYCSGRDQYYRLPSAGLWYISGGWFSSTRVITCVIVVSQVVFRIRASTPHFSSPTTRTFLFRPSSRCSLAHSSHGSFSPKPSRSPCPIILSGFFFFTREEVKEAQC